MYKDLIKIDNKKLTKLLEVSLYLGSTLDLDELLDRINNTFREILNTEDASIILYNHETEELYFYQVTNVDDERTLEKIILKSGEGIAGYVARNKESIIVNDARNDPRHDKRADETTGKVTRNLIAVPIMYQDRFMGVMEGMNKKEGDFNDEDLTLALSIGNMVAISLENAKLHKETENNLKRIKELEAAKSEFISIISHELKTPITPIMGYIDLILAQIKNIDRDMIKDFLLISKERVYHLNMLIKDLFVVNEVDEFRTNLFIKEADIRELIKERVENWDRIRGTHPINVEIGEADSPERFKMKTDSTKISHCLYHLIDNGSKFSPEGTPITIKLDMIKLKGEDAFQISVKDKGIGIARENQEKVFEKFFQISQGLTREYGGLGIGLFICKKIVEAHNGVIFCESEPGKGSTFYVQIPLIGQ